jgi:hypothetical protein
MILHLFVFQNATPCTLHNIHLFQRTTHKIGGDFIDATVSELPMDVLNLNGVPHSLSVWEVFQVLPSTTLLFEEKDLLSHYKESKSV